MMAKKDSFPITQQAVLALFQDKPSRALAAEEIADALGVTDWQGLLALLRHMEAEFLLVVTKKGRYLPAAAAGIFRSVFHGKRGGYGFCETGDPLLGDLFIKAAASHGAMDGDTVLVQIEPQKRPRHKYQRHLHSNNKAEKRREGVVLQILNRANQQVVGIYYEENRLGFLLPNNKNISQEIIIPAKGRRGAKSGDAVVAKIVTWPQRRHPALAEVTEILGQTDTPGIDMTVLSRQYGFAETFPKAVLKQSRFLAERGLQPEDYQGRRDLRDWTIVTIDGLDAKDLDDGVSIEREGEGWVLGVHIADVSHYVTAGSPLDREAMARGTSVYLPGLVIPMLPPELSNDLCSLNAGVDRLAMSCVMHIRKTGSIAKYEIFPSVIQVRQRLCYEKANLYYTQGTEYQKFAPLLQELQAMMQARLAFRRRRGSIDFDFPETKVILDENSGKVLELRRREQGIAEKVIEEAMICANEAVATEYHRRQIPFIYRVHLGPSGDKLAALNSVLGPLGYPLPLRDIAPKDVQKLLAHFADKPMLPLVELAALRAMPHAYYDVAALGHFGLASAYYSHFTSPIRRYADLAIHRVIKQWPKGARAPKEQSYHQWENMLKVAAQAASQTEKTAEEAEREALDIKRCLYMAEHVGETFNGVISGGNNYGIYVELDNTVEGMIRVDDLPPDDYTFSAATFTMQGRQKKHRYALGDSLNVVVSRVDVEARQIDFILSNHQE